MKSQELNYKLIEAIAIDQASYIAREGHLETAEELISPFISKASDIRAIDLLAKIYAQQGRTEEAKKLWEHAMQIDPTNKDFIKAIERCDDCWGLNVRYFITKNNLDMIIAILLIFLLGYLSGII